MKKPEFRYADFIIIAFVILIALFTRLYKINAPVADLHSWRQADTAAVARNFARDGIDMLRPKYDDLSGRESGRENPEGFRMVEFPVYNAIVAINSNLIPFLSLDVHARLVNIIFSLATIFVIYFLLFRESGRIAAFFASLVYAVFPFFVFFSRVILPEPTAVGLCFISILFFYLFAEKEMSGFSQAVFFLLSAIFFSLSILVKPTVIFYVIVHAYLLFRKYKFLLWKSPYSYLFLAIGFFPLLLWRTYIKNYPEGIPASDWLLTSVNTYQGLKTIFLRPAFFRWIFFERLNHMIFGGYLSVFFILGIMKKSSRYFFHSILAAAFIYLFVFEGGNVQHEYYQTIILPAVAIFTGLGIEFLWSIRKNLLPPTFVIVLTSLIFVFSFFFSYYLVKEFYNVPADLTSIARIIRTITAKDDKIITDRMGDTTLLYLADRKGWPNYSGNLDTLKDQGYKYFVTANSDLKTELKEKKTYKAVFENDNFTIFAL